jgi:OmpA-OmpF porin, OOP family
MKTLYQFLLLLSVVSLTAACSQTSKEKTQADTTKVATSEPLAEKKIEIPVEKTENPTSTEGFDPASMPVSSQTLGAFPYVSLIEGYAKMDRSNQNGSAEISSQKDVAFDRYEFFDGTKLIPIEGRLITIRATGKGASSFQVMKTYETLITGLGGVKVWQGSGKVMYENEIKFEDERHRGNYQLAKEDMGVYVVKTQDREVWVEAYKTWQQKDANSDNYWLTVVEREALPMKASILPAEQLKKELDANGRVALYINFDTDKASIKSESQPIVEQVVKLLKANPDLKLTVEGHTDNAGTPDYNRQLSESRAKAVMTALTGQGIASSRLKAIGFGQTKPLADNANEQGKAKNRRVELVKQ